MKVYKCDRCGAIYNRDELIVDLSIVDKKSTTGWHSYDLCADCEKQVIAWLKGEEQKIEPYKSTVLFNGCEGCDSKYTCDDAFWSTAPNCNKYNHGERLKKVRGTEK